MTVDATREISLYAFTYFLNELVLKRFRLALKLVTEIKRINNLGSCFLDIFDKKRQNCS